jgi:hypothetical protein
MRAAVIVAVALTAATVMPAQGRIRLLYPVGSAWQLAPVTIQRGGIIPPADRYANRINPRFGRSAQMNAMRIGSSISPLAAALPTQIWRGRIRRFGESDGAGLSGAAIRARTIGPPVLQSQKHVSGFLASEVHYGLQLDGDDLLTFDATGAAQRLPAAATIGRGQSVHVTSLYLGGSLVHARQLSLAGGWYRVSTSKLEPLDRLVERAAGMPAAGQGMRLALEWQPGPEAESNRSRIGLELRGSSGEDLSLNATPHRDRRALIRFATSF